MILNDDHFYTIDELLSPTAPVLLTNPSLPELSNPTQAPDPATVINNSSMGHSTRSASDSLQLTQVKDKDNKLEVETDRSRTSSRWFAIFKRTSTSCST